ncbi:MAG: hypothetical protein M1470_13280 [Bacteroidetes bacterium]|nr:hypothetical protein [Bacteroidota bacterium]
MKHGNGNWLRYYRSATENEFYFAERFTRWQGWVDLLTLACFAPRTVFIRGIEFHLQPGDMIESQKTLAKRWKWSDNTVRKFLNLLSARGQISIKVRYRISVISISNWALYQGTDNEGAPQTAPQTALAMRMVKNVKKEDMQPFFRCEFFSVNENDAFNYRDTFNLSEAELLSELKRMSLWLEKNPAKRKKNYGRFIVNWLSRRNGDGTPQANSAKRFSRTEAAKYAKEHSFTVANFDRVVRDGEEYYLLKSEVQNG